MLVKYSNIDIVIYVKKEKDQSKIRINNEGDLKKMKY